jgi:hypothetical protein
MNTNEDPVARDARDYFVNNTRSFFLMSNQFPLVYLNRMPSRDNRYTYDDGANCTTCLHCGTENCLHNQFASHGINWDQTSIGQFVLDKRKSNPCFQLVNFSDPNDILNFIVHTNRSPYCSCGATSEDLIQNVEIRNVKWALLGKYINPTSAHQDYGENPNVLWMVIHGLHRPGVDTCQGCADCDHSSNSR